MNDEYRDRKGNIINYYSIFNIPVDASSGEVKAAFRKLIKLYHPDTSDKKRENLIDKIDYIMCGYRILADRKEREEYNRFLAEHSPGCEEGYEIIPKKRIIYSASLEKMLRARMRPKNMKRKDLISSFGQDIEILVTPAEAKRGAVAYIELPSRVHCPLCTGMDPQCYICKGVGRIHTTSQLRVAIPGGIIGGTIIEADLMKLRPGRLTSFRAKNIRIKITLVQNC